MLHLSSCVPQKSDVARHPATKYDGPECPAAEATPVQRSRTAGSSYHEKTKQNEIPTAGTVNIR